MIVIFFGKTGSNAVNLLKHGFDIDAGFTNEKDSLAIKEFEKRGIKVEIVKNLEEQLQKVQSKIDCSSGIYANNSCKYHKKIYHYQSSPLSFATLQRA